MLRIDIGAVSLAFRRRLRALALAHAAGPVPALRHRQGRSAQSHAGRGRAAFAYVGLDPPDCAGWEGETVKLQITIHVFGYGADNTERRDEVWTADMPDTMAAKGINPLLLRADVYGETHFDMFSLERIEGDTAHYFPFATHLKLKFLERLPKFGWTKVEPGEIMSQDIKPAQGE